MISENRWKHILGVARKAKFLAEQLRPSDEKYQEDMFLLGLLHDVGYEFAQTNTQHAKVGGDMLRRTGYRYWQEVALHGENGVVTMSDELFILNLADMTTLPDGISCSMDERIKEIALRYGENSPAHLKTVAMAKKLQNDERYKKIKLG